MTELAKEFKQEPVNLLDQPEAYQAMLEALVAQSEGVGKTTNLAAYKLPNIKIETLTSSGQSETTRDVAVTFQAGKTEAAYLLIDMEQYPLERTRQQIVVDMAAKWGQKTIKERDLNSADYSGAGIWVNKASAVEFDYRPLKGTKDVWEPNPEATRVVLEMTKAVKIPVQWDGGFLIEAGGHAAVRERDVADIAAALASIRAGEKTAAEALYSKEGVAKFDVYGTEPGFVANNYGARALQPATLAAVGALTQAQPACSCPHAQP